jgi:hypothetical protein
MRQGRTRAVVKTPFSLIFVASVISPQNIDVGLKEPLAPIVIVMTELPSGCHLAKHLSVEAGVTTIVGSSIPDNPWVGDDIGVISKILQEVDPPILVPDGPPDRKTVTSMWLDGARKISDGAVAIYDSGVGLISVYALRYRHAVDLKPDTPARNETAKRFDLRRGAVRIVMFGDASECSVAIARHVRSMLPKDPGR